MTRQSGFTLIELMIAMAILAIITAVAIPDYISWRATQQLRSSAREILSAIQSSRMRAIRDQVKTVVLFDMATSSYEAFVDDGEGSVDGDLNGEPDNAGNKIRDGKEDVIALGQLPGNAGFSKITLVSSRAVFNGRGMLDGINGSVYLTISGGKSLQIVLYASGNAKIKIPNQD